MVIEFLRSEISNDGHDIEVRLEPVTKFTRWVRGFESLTLLEPRPIPTPLALIGLGKSVSGNVTAEAIVVTSYTDLAEKAHLVPGKIVVFAVPWYDG